jgi:hypothetical protein
MSAQLATPITGYEFWIAQLAGATPDLPSKEPQPGFYRTRRDEPVAVWRTGDDDLVAKVGDGRIVEADETWAERVFAGCCRRAVTEQDYRARLASGKWPDEVAAPARNSNAEPHIQIEETIAELRSEAEAWLASIGGEIKTKADADKAGNFADRFAELDKEAEKARVEQKEPHFKAAKAVDGTWQPIVAKAKEAKRWVASLCTAYLQAEKARKVAEASAKVVEGKAVHPSDVTVKAGSRGRGVQLRTVKVGEIIDYPAFLAAVKDFPDVLAFMADLANRIAKLPSGEHPVGMKIVSEQRAQ